MTDNGLCVRMLVMRVGVMNALFKEIAQATVTDDALVALRQVAPKRIHGDLQDQPRWCLIRVR